MLIFQEFQKDHMTVLFQKHWPKVTPPRQNMLLSAISTTRIDTDMLGRLFLICLQLSSIKSKLASSSAPLTLLVEVDWPLHGPFLFQSLGGGADEAARARVRSALAKFKELSPILTALVHHMWRDVHHCGLVGSAPTWDGTGYEFDSWQCRIYIPCSLSLRLLGFLRGSGYIWLDTKIVLKKRRKRKKERIIGPVFRVCWLMRLRHGQWRLRICRAYGERM